MPLIIIFHKEERYNKLFLEKYWFWQAENKSLTKPLLNWNILVLDDKLENGKDIIDKFQINKSDPDKIIFIHSKNAQHAEKFLTDAGIDKSVCRVYYYAHNLMPVPDIIYKGLCIWEDKLFAYNEEGQTEKMVQWCNEFLNNLNEGFMLDAIIKMLHRIWNCDNKTIDSQTEECISMIHKYMASKKYINVETELTTTIYNKIERILISQELHQIVELRDILISNVISE